ncbi:STAS domain-containing protein [Streptomyces sp. KAU_LT]|uniref:STAS domain-containing protein n=1 Tax=unclassified Streptomyces TaxID=2593676 RepID=UPI0024B672D1|nr:STAS domain-containing protein [Streptomyces sp. KAU_LT]MDI9832963.1 STAS domain-containing protein [Streptomyces sp. KAU_LT]
MNALKISTRDAATGPVLEVAGDLDYLNAGQLRDLLPTITVRPGQRLVVDLGALDFCDSSGITALIAAHHHAQSAGGQLMLAAVPANTLRILSIVGLDQVLTIHPDSEAATRV